MNLELRPAGTQDAAAMAALDQNLNPTPWSRQLFEQAVLDAQALVAVSDQHLAGFIVFAVAAEECEIHGIAVQPHFQRAGIGGRLLLAALAEAGRSGAAHCFLEVRESNLAAQQLYLAHGFVQSGRRKAYYRSGAGQEDALLYRRELR